MKKLLTVTVFIFITTIDVNAGTRFQDLTYDYFYGKDSKVSTNVKRVIATDSETSPKVLKILIQDNDVAVWLAAKANLRKLF